MGRTRVVSWEREREREGKRRRGGEESSRRRGGGESSRRRGGGESSRRRGGGGGESSRLRDEERRRSFELPRGGERLEEWAERVGGKSWRREGEGREALAP